ncbi:hypothetical protein AB0759_20540 [Scytonema tolypothrichoides VB-61278_2]|uniref:Transposase n=1 Tax=Scytonema tolypothrichoides VB-61278_2 TaxID=3232314 RepID=A0ABW8WPY8_9CYAN|nr:hypothetical protein [Tolypothrix bouteillei]
MQQLQKNFWVVHLVHHHLNEGKFISGFRFANFAKRVNKLSLYSNFKTSGSFNFVK